ncbi:MAG: MarR family winged helix-turn-helix transcriptional regulator [Gaiellaceae bacterium]
MIVRAPRLVGDDQADTGHVATGLAKIGLVLRNEAWQGRKQSGLTPTQGQILALLLAREGSELRLGEIATGLGVTPATASDSLRVLAAKGLVAKERAAGDGRALAVRLTRRGRRLAAEEAEWPDFLLAAIDTLTPAERRAFLRGLVKMIRTLQEQGRIPVARMCVSCRFFRPDVHADAARPHHCAFVDAPFGDGELRIDCADQEPLPPREARELWDAFLSGQRGGR